MPSRSRVECFAGQATTSLRDTIRVAASSPQVWGTFSSPTVSICSAGRELEQRVRAIGAAMAAGDAAALEAALALGQACRPAAGEVKVFLTGFQSSAGRAGRLAGRVCAAPVSPGPAAVAAAPRTAAGRRRSLGVGARRGRALVWADMAQLRESVWTKAALYKTAPEERAARRDRAALTRWTMWIVCST